MEPWLERAAALRPNRIAVEAPDGSITYCELLDRARRISLDGEPVPIALPPGLDFVVTLHACLLSGRAAMPIDLRLSERERAAPTRVGKDVALVMHTSGTTGEPTPVELTYAQIHAQRARHRRGARPRRGRALAVPAAAEPRRRPDGAAAVA